MALEIFSTSRLKAFQSIREDEVRLLLKNLHRSSSQKVEMKSKLSEQSFNVIMRMVAGKRYFGVDEADSDEAKLFRDIIKEFFEISGASDPGNFIPALRWLNYHSIEKRMKILHKKADSFMQSLIDEKRIRTRKIGPDTSAATIEWALSLLLNHPAVLKKAKAEVDNYVGHDRLVDEADLAKLPYIQSIVNETLRLYPVAPLLAPHESSDDTTIGGYHVPRQTMLMVNAWAIHRDPKVWDDPTSFKPERFEGLMESGHEAYNYKFVPFGLGRRACPGAGLANRVMGFSLAALIQCFEWERISEEEVDMSQGTGITMPKAKPLEAMCKSRHSMFFIRSGQGLDEHAEAGVLVGDEAGVKPLVDPEELDMVGFGDLILEEMTDHVASFRQMAMTCPPFSYTRGGVKERLVDGRKVDAPHFVLKDMQLWLPETYVALVSVLSW
ncbi:hypothetical protein EZV62_017160 [Acer yangbiense]|uniref:Cytochrome P450 n=1 Tax=Acer yangbiense TaxID=1000413 RepID=A0A5C7HFU5_9ROSI|nr:hypothetical protein EZV62_017160 [Acer yangbiense]